jgi:hypothetical protein
LLRNAEEVQENTRREIQFLKDHLESLQEHVNLTHDMNARLKDELQKQRQTGVDMPQLRANTSFQETSEWSRSR